MLYRPPDAHTVPFAITVWNGLIITAHGLANRNYRFFYRFVFSTTLLCLYVFAFCWVYVFKIREAEHLSFGKAMLKTPASIALIGYCFLVCGCGWSVCLPCYLMSTNQLCRQPMRISDTAMIVALTHIIERYSALLFPVQRTISGQEARVTVEQGLQQSRVQSRGFMSPNMGKPTGDLEMGRKPVAWDEPRTAADIRDLEAGLGGMFDEKEAGRIAHASPDLSRDGLPSELVEGRAGMHSRHSSWVNRTGTSDSGDRVVMQMAAMEDSMAAMRGAR
ncbi:hypothetical protein EJB05_50537, partial [Eragrostis curvula]